MKYLLLLLLLGLSLTSFSQQQKPFEGTLVFDIAILNATADMEVIKSVMPSGITLKIKGENVRVSMQGGILAGMFGDVVTHAPSQKQFFRNDVTQTVTYIADETTLKAASAGDFELIEGTDSRTILGYACKHYIVRSEVDATTTMAFWVAPALTMVVPKTASNGPLVQSSLYGLQGLALRSEVDQMGIKMVVEVKSIQLESLPDGLFELPKNYKIIQTAPALSDFGGNDD